MNSFNRKETAETRRDDSKSLPFLGKSLLVGLLAGIVVSCYRLIISEAEDFTAAAYAFISANPHFILPLFIVLAAFAYAVSRIVKAQPLSAGSGVPQVKALVKDLTIYNWWKVLLAKFLGGTLSALGGLALGREGPCVQLGGCVGQGVGERFSRSLSEKKILIASGAGAGMGAALNAPLAGVMFAFEDIFKYFSPKVLLSAMTAAVSAQFVCRSIFGIEPILDFGIITPLPLTSYWLVIVFGVLLGLIGVFYDFILICCRRLYARIPSRLAVLKPGIAFFIAGVLGLVLPAVIGSGANSFGSLNLAIPLGTLLLLYLVKFLFVIICLGSDAPGGDLFPLLLLGGMLGAIFGNISVNYLGFAPEYFANFVILGMGGYFGAVVGAPVTAIVLMVEITGSFPQMLSLALICLVAYTVINLLKKSSFYQQLQKKYQAEELVCPWSVSVCTDQLDDSHK